MEGQSPIPNPQPTTATHHDLIKRLLQDGLGEEFPKTAELLMNAAMLMERAKHIGAGPYEPVEARNVPTKDLKQKVADQIRRIFDAEDRHLGRAKHP